MLEAKGLVRVFTDVDVPFGTDGIRAAEHYIRTRGFHLVVGDRTLPDSEYLEATSPVRRLASRIFTVFVGRLVTGGFFDTQCGLKGFRGDVAERLFNVSRVDRFAFDVELIYLALKHKLDIKRIAVRLERNEESSVRVMRDAPRMLIDVTRVLWHQYRGGYVEASLLQLAAADERREREFYLTR
jgi:dolichyl-phosphate beta-glucosyltransferase